MKNGLTGPREARGDGMKAANNIQGEERGKDFEIYLGGIIIKVYCRDYNYKSNCRGYKAIHE